MGGDGAGGPEDARVLAARRLDVWNAALSVPRAPRLHVAQVAAALPARLFRMSYSGELAYEIPVPADRGRRCGRRSCRGPADAASCRTAPRRWARFASRRATSRGAELDGRTTAGDLGMGGSSTPASGAWASRCSAAPALTAPDRWQLVGLTALDGARMPRGAKLVADPERPPPNPMQGHVASWCFSPHCKAWIALALLESGRARHGEQLWAVSPLADAKVRVQVGSPCFIDPDGERLRV